MSALLLVPACSDPDSAPPASVPASASASTAPRVQHPLSPRAGVLLRAPCAVLPGASAAGLGLPAETKHEGIAGSPNSACQWLFEGGARLTIAWPVETPSLDAMYSRRADYKYFEETTVLGYPAVFANTAGDRAGGGHCVLNVGVNDRLVFYAAAQTLDERGENPTQDACVVARNAATAVIQELQKR